MKKLAHTLNTQLKELPEQRHRFIQGDIELKSAVTNISHDLRTPLTAVSGYLDLLDREEKSDTVNRYLKIIKNRTETMKQLTEELFSYSIITSPEYDAPLELLSINHVLEECIITFYTTLQQRKITPKINIPENKVTRELNHDSLYRIIENIIGNAVKYSDGDLNISLSTDGTIVFSNHAVELTEIQVRRLFDRFYTVSNARKSTGLGLSIAKTLTEKMGGVISADYKNSVLTIYVTFPENKAGDNMGK